MKRKAPQALGSESPTKLSKETADKNDVNQVTNSSKSAEISKESASTPIRSSSSRQRKAPAWLSSYVTNSSTSKESPKLTSSEVSAETSSVKKKGPKISQVKKEADGQSKPDEEPPSLRRRSTLKIEDSPPRSVKNKKPLNMLTHSTSLVKRETEILISAASDSGDSALESKPGNVPSHLNKSLLLLSSQSSNSSQTLPKPTPKLSSKQHIKLQSSIHMHGVDADELNSSNVVEVCDTKSVPLADSAEAAYRSLEKWEPSTEERQKSTETQEKPKMLEIVVCISTSGAMRDYLTVLQEKTRDLVWQLQSLIPDLRIGVLAHTQGGIHDDKPGSGSSAIDHNYIRTGGHSGTKWLDLGATFSQICAFVDSLEPEATVYPDYVQDNLEMALWKVQRCMSWSSCSYRTVVMIGRGRPNRTSFYLQREHWRGWIRSALEIGAKAEIPVIDWELEAKFLAQMGIHVFTIQASSAKTSSEEEEDEGSIFFRRVAEITNGLHVRLTEAPKLVDIIVGICCSCHGPELLQNHRDRLRDENDGVLPSQLKDIFVSLQLHSKRRSLSTLPSLVGDLSILQKQLAKADANGNISSSEEEEISEDEQTAGNVTPADRPQESSSSYVEIASGASPKSLTKSQNKKGGAKSSSSVQKAAKRVVKSVAVKSGRASKNLKSQATKSETVAGKVVKAAKIARNEQTVVKNVPVGKNKTDKTVLANAKNVARPDTGKQSLKTKNAKQTKVLVKQAQNVKAGNKTMAQKNMNTRARPAQKSTASQKRGKKAENQTSNSTTSLAPGTPSITNLPEPASSTDTEEAECNCDEVPGEELLGTVLSCGEQLVTE